MSSEERKKILQMVADGRITADEAATLMRALEQTPEEDQVLEPEAGSRSRANAEPEFEEVRNRAMRLAVIPLWIGILVTVVSAWGMFAIQQNAGYNFWFFSLTVPLLLGIFLITLGAGSRTSRWIYLNVDRSQRNDWPRNITLAFPLPLGLAGWFLQNFGSYIGGLKHTNVDEVVQAISMAKSIKEPLIINVDDAEDGERVQVFIG
jgi:hypothetical protein